MPDSILVAVCSLAGTIIGSLAGILAANKLTNYRIAQLETKVDKHNTLIERTIILERDALAMEKRMACMENEKGEHHAE